MAPVLNGASTPDNVSPGMKTEVFWKCTRNRKHDPFPQRIWNRTSLHQGCPACDEEERKDRTRTTENARLKAQRERASALRPITAPPVLGRAERNAPLPLGGPTMTPGAAATTLGRSAQTIRNWIRSGRMRAHPAVHSRAPFLIPESEVLRVQAILGKLGDHGLEAA